MSRRERRKERIFLKPEDYKNILSEALDAGNMRNYLLMRMMGELGLRNTEVRCACRELLPITDEDEKLYQKTKNPEFVVRTWINIQTKTVFTIGKGNVERSIPINKSLYNSLRQYVLMNKNKFLFPSRVSNRNFITKEALNYEIISPYAKNINNPSITPHAFRRYFSTRIVLSCHELQIPHEQIKKEMMGHKLGVSEIYTETPWEWKVDAVNKAFNT